MRYKLLPVLIAALCLQFTVGISQKLSAQTVTINYFGKCLGSPTSFSCQVTGFTPVSYAWDFGDGQVGAGVSVTNTYAAANTSPGYYVQVVVTDNVGGTHNDQVYVYIQSPPVAFFSVQNPTACHGDTIHFNDLSYPAGGLGYIKQWIWKWGDGSQNDTFNFPNNPYLVGHLFPQNVSYGTYPVQLQVMTNDSCVSSVIIPVTTVTSPIANFQSTGECEDQVIQFTDASSPNGSGVLAYWNWNFDDPGSGIDNTSASTNPIHTFQTAGTYNVRLVVTNFNGCTDTISKPITVRAHPTIDFSFSAATCLNKLIDFNPIPASTPTIPNFYWDFGDGLSATNRNPSHQYTSPGTYTVKLTVTDQFGCMNEVEHIVKVNPLPIANFYAGVNNCAGQAVAFDENSNVPFVGYITQWSWDFGDGGTAVVNFPTGDPNVTHVYANPGTFQVTLHILTSDGCEDFETQTITINPTPVPNFTFSTPACYGTAVDFTDISQLGGGGTITQHVWDFGDLPTGISNTSSLANPQHTFSAPGTFSVSMIVYNASGCHDTMVKQVVVADRPAVDFTWDNSCQQKSITFSTSATIMPPATIATWHWDFGDLVTSNAASTATHTYSNAGTYTVTLTVTGTNGCVNSLSKTIFIEQKPTVLFSHDLPSCMGTAITFHDQSIAYNDYINQWDWDFGDGGTTTVTLPASSDVQHTFANGGTFNVKLTVTTNNGCTAEKTLPISVSQNPLSNFSWDPVTCANSAIQFHDEAQPGSGSIISWHWDFGDAASGANNISYIQNPQHTFNGAATYQVTLLVTNSNGCTHSFYKSITINPLPVIDFTFQQGCVDDTTSFTGTLPAGYKSVLWDFGDGFTATGQASPIHIYQASGTYLVSLTLTDANDCVNTITKSVQIAPKPLAFFTTSGLLCSKKLVQFEDNSSTVAGTISSWYWTFGDGHDTLINAPGNPDVTHQYQLAGSYKVVLKIITSQGCDDTTSITIAVKASPQANFDFDNTCEDQAVQFTDHSTVNNGTNIVGWSWNFGDPSSGAANTSGLQNPAHTYAASGTYTAALVVSNMDGCNDVKTRPFIIKAKPGVQFVWDSVCLGSPTHFTTTSPTVAAAVASYSWDFGDGSPLSTDPAPTHTYAATGNYPVILSIVDTGSCINSVQNTIGIIPKPTALFAVSSACKGSATQFTDMSFMPNGEPIASWLWNFGSGSATSTLQNPTFTYPAAGPYTVTLTVASAGGCKNTKSLPVQVYENPTANFTYTAAPCENSTVYFQDSSYSQSSILVGWNWEFDPYQYSTLPNPVHVFPASDSCYQVRLTVTDNHGCKDTVNTGNVTYKAVCIPESFDFAFSSTTTCLGDTTFFTTENLVPTTDSLLFFNWTFGDPTSGLQNTSTLREPFHIYHAAATYTVTLQAFDENNCNKIKQYTVVVHPLPDVQFAASTGPCTKAVSFDDKSNGSGAPITEWTWDLGDGTTNTITPPSQADITHDYAAEGVYVVSLKVVNSIGCEQVKVDSNVFVKPCVQALYTVSDTVCAKYDLDFVDNSFSGLPLTHWRWDFGDGSVISYTSLADTITHQYAEPGLYNAELLITTEVSGREVSDSITKQVIVMPSPDADFATDILCAGMPVEFHDSTQGNFLKHWNWEFNLQSSAADTSTFRDPVYSQYPGSGEYRVRLIVTNKYACNDTVTKNITVNDRPNANLKYTTSCAGSQTEFSDLSTLAEAPLNQWSWTFFRGTEVLGNTEEQNPVFVFNVPGDQTAKLIVVDTNGCYDSIIKTVTVHATPQSIFNYVENFNDIQGQLQLVNNSIDAVKYQWNFGNGDESTAENTGVFYKDDGSYKITLITWNSYGCSDTMSTVYEFVIKGLFVPTAFAPDYGKPEVTLFKPVGVNIKEYSIEVYDRWGNMLWHSEEVDENGRPTEGWNGTYNGTACQQGIYTWRASAIFKDGSVWEAQNIGNNKGMPLKKFGTVTLIR